ncbi:MAG: response regulator [Gemmatimonadetes bacterium]|nr:response regulator [Gemmatimonadota bacterium]
MTPVTIPGDASHDATEASAETIARVTEKVEAMVRLAGGVAHDFNNLLTVIAGNAEGILERGVDGELRVEIAEISDAARRAAVLTHQLLAFSRQLVLHPRATHLDRVLDLVWDDLARLAGPGVRLTRHTRVAGGVVVDQVQLAAAVRQLVCNAIEAMPGGGEVHVTVEDADLDDTATERLHPMPAGGYVLLEVRDTGTGMDDETLRRAMEPFFTTKGQKHGTGMGLPTVYGIVKQSGGFMWLDSSPGEGTTCRLFFPRIAEPSLLSRSRTPARIAGGDGQGSILLVEDEDLVRQLTRRTLVRAGYHVVEAPNAHAALVEVRERGLTPTLLLTDVVMPGMDGRELATMLEGELPGLAVILMSGFVDPRVPLAGREGSTRVFLEKPFTLDRLRDLVRDAMRAPQVN